MPVTVYKSTDTSAPVLTGLAGALITVLDAILVTGYGTKAAAGWGKAFTGTNLAAYRAPSGARHYLRVDDSASGTHAAGKEAFLRAFEAMTAISTGTMPFPTTTQLASGCFVRKSITADATARPWVCVADERTFYFFADSGDYSGYASFMFGEFFSVKSTADAYRSILIARGIQETIGSTVNPMTIPTASDETLEQLSALTVSLPGHYCPRPFNEVPFSTRLGKHGNAAHSAAHLVGIGNYPNPVDNAVYLSQVWLHEAATNPIIRGRLRGFWHILHPVGIQINNGDTWSGTGALVGKTFVAIKPTAAGLGMFVIETSSTWETN